ncbi:MAG: peptidylprolyl isomerase [Clostridia bacterium]
MKKWLIVGLVLALGVLGGCAKQETPEVETPKPIVTIEMEDGSVMQAELYPAIAPNTVANFVNLIEQGFYDQGIIFHRVIPGFMIQGGDPTGTGMGGPDYTIKGEFKENGIENDLKHVRGVLSMGRTGDPNSAGSQFFIMHGDGTYLDGQYAAFGKLIGDASYEALDVIANTPTDAMDKPMLERKIKKVTVDTKGYQYTVVKYEAED